MNYTSNNPNFIKAITYIYKQIDKPLTLDQIAQHVGISTASLKRLFIDATEQSAGSFIRKLRMEHAFKSIHQKKNSILETALEVGFEDHAAFSRCFKNIFGYTPSIGRKKIHLVDELESIQLEEPTIVELDNIVVQAATAQGTYFQAAPEAWDQLEKQIDKAEIDDDSTATFIGIGHDNPHEQKIAHDQVRFSACIAHTEKKYPHLQTTTIVGGLYAQFHYHGKLINLGLAYHYIFGAWNNTNNNSIDHARPAFIIFDQFPSNFKKQNLIISVPIKNQ